MKCEQYTCSKHTVLGCDCPLCFYFDGKHNEVNAAAPQPEEKSELK